MGIRTIGAGAPPSSIERVLIDLTEALDGFSAEGAGSASPYADGRGRAPQGGATVSGNASRILGTNSGAPTLVYDGAIGRALVQVPSVFPFAGRVGGLQGGTVTVPVCQRFGVAGALPISLFRPLRRYTFSVPVRRTIAGANQFQLGFAVASNMLSLNAGTNPAAVWESTAALNGGAYTPRIRQVVAGAITDGPSSGRVPAAARFDLLGLRYTEGPIPTIEWLIDNIPLFVVSGDALMPTRPTAAQPFYCGYGVGNAAGDTWQQAGARFIVEEIS